MKRSIYYILILTILASCSNEHKKREAPKDHIGEGSSGKIVNRPPLNAYEQEGIKDVTGFYGGECNYATGKTANDKLYFLIEISNSMAIENTKNIVGLSSANIACIFYQDVMSLNKYDEIRVKINLSDSEKLAAEYPVASLAIVLAKMKTVQAVVNLLKEKNYKGLGAMLNNNNSIAKFDKKKLIDEIEKADGPLGKIEMFIPYGYAFHRAEDGNSVLRISGVLKRDKQNNEFSVLMNPDTTKSDVLMINYKL
jgi:hypothetical protein